MVLLSLFASPTETSWSCRNQVEIRCAGDKCESVSNDEFTPMSIAFNGNGNVSVCAYTGCWEGTGRVTSSEDFLTITAKDLPFSTNITSTQSVSLTLDKKDNIGIVKAGEFAQPIVCKRTKKE